MVSKLYGSFSLSFLSDGTVPGLRGSLRGSSETGSQTREAQCVSTAVWMSQVTYERLPGAKCPEASAYMEVEQA